MDYNRVILVGRMVNDPELKYTTSGVPVTQFRLAVNRPMSSEARQSGQDKQVDFIPVVAWRQSAEFASNYLHKGRLVLVEGRMQVREYVTQDGQKRRETEVIADNLKGLDSRKDAPEGGGGYRSQPEEYGGESAARTQSAPAAARRPAPASTGQFAPPPMDDDMDDPFADN